MQVKPTNTMTGKRNVYKQYILDKYEKQIFQKLSSKIYRILAGSCCKLNVVYYPNDTIII